MNCTPNTPQDISTLFHLEGAPTMPIVEAAGSARQIGSATGESLRCQIRENLEKFPMKLDPRQWNRRKPALLAALNRYLPQAMEELQATARAANVAFDELLYLNTEPQYGVAAPIEDRCTNVVFAGGPDGPIWGKNNDRPAAEPPRATCARLIHRTGQLPLVVFTYAGLLCTLDGMNAAGLAVGHSSVGSVFEQSDAHPPIRLWGYEGLMRCRTTDQFIAHMTAHPLRGKGYAMVCVDAQGTAVSIEAPCPLAQVRRSTHPHGHLHCVNLYQLPALAQADRRSSQGKCNAQQRRQWLDQALQSVPKTDLPAMQTILRRTDAPAICRTAAAPDTSLTEYSMIALPQQRRVQFLYGNPAAQDYQAVTFKASPEPVVRSTPSSSKAIDAEELRQAIDLGCIWVQDIAQIRTDSLPSDTDNRQGFGYTSWRGAIRGEYSAADRRWWLFCPVWHTGQAVKALIQAAEALDQPRYLQGARAGADFIFDKQVWDEKDPNHGLILAFEDIADQVNTSAVLEAMDGLMLWADHENSERMWQRLIAAGRFLIDHLFVPELGLFRDLYIPAERRIGSVTRFRTKDQIGGRPLLDDGILLKLYARTGEERFLDTHLKIAQRLLEDQNPPGNWIDYGPCDVRRNLFHPRHTYWWGLPLIDTYRQTGREDFLQTAIASGEFCRRAMRRDGGYIRGTYGDFNTDSFGHATSGSACAAILFLRLYRQTGDETWFQEAATALSFCMSVQFRRTRDPNLQGAILEKILPPDGADRSPYYLRDLGTIFFIIAGVEYLKTVSRA